MFTLLGGTVLLSGKSQFIGYWFLAFGVFFFWWVRRRITMVKIAEGIVFLGGYILIAAVATFLFPELGRYPSERAHSYPMLIPGICFVALGYGLRIAITKKLKQAPQTPAASRRF